MNESSVPLRFSLMIQWSEEDAALLVTLPEWEGRVFNPVTHGATYEEAAKHGLEVLEGIIASAVDHGEALPDPSYARLPASVM